VEPEPVDPSHVLELAAVAHRVAGAQAGPPVVLAHRTDELVIRCGGVVAKRHAPDTDAAELAVRLALLAGPALREVVLAPLACESVAGRLVTVWPAGSVLHPAELDDTPWESVATLLARLHATAPPPELPPSGGPVRVARALRRLAAHRAWGGPRARAVVAAYETLPAWARGAAPPPRAGLLHGDFHLGQLVRLPSGGWRLIDVDDLGSGDPAWDLARPAAWFAAGLLPAEAWHRFLTAYRAAGGVAVPGDGDPWPALEIPARALAVQTAALAMVNSDLEVAPAFVACCVRIARQEAAGGVHPLSKLLRR